MVGEHREFKFGTQVDCGKSQPTDDKLSRDLFKFSGIIDNISEMVQDIELLWNTNRKSCMAYRMGRLSMTLNEAEGHVCCFKPLSTVDRRPSPVDHTQRSALCTAR